MDSVHTNGKPLVKDKDFNLKALKLPPKRTVSVNSSEAKTTMVEASKERLEKIKSGEAFAGVGRDEPNNSFLWLLALLPFFAIAAVWLFVVYPLEHSTFIIFGDNLPRIGDRLGTSCAIWIIAMNTLFAGLDEHELSRRGKNAGNGFVAFLAFTIVPIYLLMRGRKELNHGSQSYAPYITWWAGWLVFDFLTELGIGVIIVSVVIAITIVLFTLLLATGEEPSKETANVATENNRPSQPSALSALGVKD